MTLTASFEFETSGIDDLLKKLEDAVSPASLFIAYSLVARQAERIIKLKYPPQSRAPLPLRYQRRTRGGQFASGRSKFKSQRAQRGFFAKLRSGEISIPYRRTGNLGRSLVFKIVKQGDKAALAVSIPSSSKAGAYADFVVGDPQDLYFAQLTQWEPLAVMLTKQAPEIEEALKVAIESFLEDIADAT